MTDAFATGTEAESTRPPAESEPAAGYGWTPAALCSLRRRTTLRRGLLVVALLAGVTLAWIHWLGLFAAGGLVGLCSRTVPRAVGAGLFVGLLVLVGHVLASPAMGAAAFLAFSPVAYVTIGAALVAPVWGSLVRAVI